MFPVFRCSCTSLSPSHTPRGSSATCPYLGDSVCALLRLMWHHGCSVSMNLGRMCAWMDTDKCRCPLSRGWHTHRGGEPLYIGWSLPPTDCPMWEEHLPTPCLLYRWGKIPHFISTYCFYWLKPWFTTYHLSLMDDPDLYLWPYAVTYIL